MAAGGPSPFTCRAGSVHVALKVTPKAAQSGVAGIGSDAAGRPHLAVRVGAAPEGGKANAALVRLLAKRWGVARSDLRVVRGAASRHKIIEIAGDAQALLDRLTAIERTS